ncbi:MAG: hypothetical protein ACRBCT_03810 [Alphaproteobacteria bacterium]
MDFLYDTNTWYAVSFAMFFAIVWKYGRPALLGYLDNRIESIRIEIEKAENLKTEAQELLAQYQRKHRDAVQEADAIIKNAKKHAAEIQTQAETELDEVIARREKQLQERLIRMEQSAVEEIKAHTANLAIEATAEIIAEKLDKKTNEALVESAIGNISNAVH